MHRAPDSEPNECEWKQGDRTLNPGRPTSRLLTHRGLLMEARAGPRTAPRAGRRIRRAHVSDERCEESALAPAARAVEPMRVARAQQAPWDTPLARDSCGTMRRTDVSLVSPLSPNLRYGNPWRSSDRGEARPRPASVGSAWRGKCQPRGGFGPPALPAWGPRPKPAPRALRRPSRIPSSLARCSGVRSASSFCRDDSLSARSVFLFASTRRKAVPTVVGSGVAGTS